MAKEVIHLANGETVLAEVTGKTPEGLRGHVLLSVDLGHTLTERAERVVVKRPDGEWEEKKARYIARKLPEALLQLDWSREEYDEVQWEMWDTIEQKRVGDEFSPLFVDEKTAQSHAEKWNFAAGPPERCGSCGKVFEARESPFVNAHYHLLCYACSESIEN